MVTRFQTALRLSGFAVALAVAPAIASAAPVAPGVSVEVDGSGFALPMGEKLAEKSINFTLLFELPPGATSSDPAPSTSGSLLNTVYRGPGGGLVFVYDVDFDNETQYADEVARFTVGSFAGFATDVTGLFEPSQRLPVMRSADGATITATQGEGLGDGPIVAIETDATAFNEGGTGEFFADAEFVVSGPGIPGGSVLDELSTTVSFTGLYQPTADDPGPTPNPIPLPPAAWAALMTMGAFGAGSRARGFFRRR